MEEEKEKIKEIIIRCPNCGREIHFPYYNQPRMKIIYDLLEEHWKECSRNGIRKIAEAHWEYTEEIINLVSDLLLHNEEEDIEISKQAKDLMHFLYVEAFIHGFKHCEDNARKLGYFEEQEIQE